MTPNRRVTWQATSDDENSWPRFSAARQQRGRSRRAAELVAQAPDVIVVTGTEATAILQPVTMEKLL
jgi:hypothetical protein